MSDGKAIKKLKRKFGTEVAHNQVTTAMEAPKAQAVRDEFLTLLRARAIPNTEIMVDEFNGKEYTIVKQIIKRAEIATTAVHIGVYGNDLLTEWRQYERSGDANAKKTLWGTILTVGGGMFFWTGLGFFIMLSGLGILLFQKPHFPEDSPNREASQLLCETVLETLAVATTNCDVTVGNQLTPIID